MSDCRRTIPAALAIIVLHLTSLSFEADAQIGRGRGGRAGRSAVTRTPARHITIRGPGVTVRSQGRPRTGETLSKHPRTVTRRPVSPQEVARRLDSIQSLHAEYRAMHDHCPPGACAAIAGAVLHHLNTGQSLSPLQRVQLARQSLGDFVQRPEDGAHYQLRTALRILNSWGERAELGANGLIDITIEDQRGRDLLSHRVPFVNTPRGVLVFEASWGGFVDPARWAREVTNRVEGQEARLQSGRVVKEARLQLYWVGTPFSASVD